MMITFVKQSMLATNYRDGNGDLDSWITKREKNYALKHRPTFYEYCNYVFPLVSSVIGPSFEFKDWNDFLDLKEPYNSMPLYSNFAPAFSRICQGLLFIGFSPLISIYFPMNDIISPEFANFNYFYRILHLWMAVQQTWWTYFVGFCLIEANLIACGFGYQKLTSEPAKDQ